ncbi:hypothetical protein K440DRAFT_217766 [Wilcoxina mikolae CBS 423.85]|nr:hypothetical protein K440DRAFT_217766 [Wilcoxina mikolae CBS 423.85]
MLNHNKQTSPRLASSHEWWVPSTCSSSSCAEGGCRSRSRRKSRHFARSHHRITEQTSKAPVQTPLPSSKADQGREDLCVVLGRVRCNYGN